MPVILAINPRKKKKPAKKKPTTKKRRVSRVKKPAKKSNPKGAKTMAKRKNRAPAKTKTILRYRTKKNPKKKRVTRAVGKSIGGINLQAAAKGTLPMLIGALAAKFAAKRFADGGAETDNWTWKNYGFGLLGGFLAAFGAASIFGGKKETAQKMMSGAFLLTAYKIFTNEIAPQNSTLDAWFSGDDALPEGYQADEEAAMMHSDNGQAFVQGADGNYLPADDSHRDIYGDGAVPVDPAMGFGDGAVPVDPAMGFGAGEQKRPQSWSEAYGPAAGAF